MDSILAHVQVSPGLRPVTALPRAEPMEVSARPDLLQEVYQVLTDACSQDPARLSLSSDRLQALEREQGTFDAEYQIAAERSLPVSVREMAMIRCKNEMVNHWQSSKLLTEQNRANIRTRATQFLTEPIDSIFNMNVIITTKLYRRDINLGGKWSAALVDHLTQIITSCATARVATQGADSENTLLLRRSLKTLHGVLKELTSAKMARAMKTMTELEPVLRPLFVQLWDHFTASFRSLLNPASLGSALLATDLEMAHLSYKCYSTTFVWKWGRAALAPPNAVDDSNLAEAVRLSAQQFNTLVDLRMQIILSLRQTNPPLLNGPAHTYLSDATLESIITLLTRHVMIFGKVFRRLCTAKRDRFVLQPPVFDLITKYWNLVAHATPSNVSDSPYALYPIRLLTQSLFLFREFMQEYSHLALQNRAVPLQQFFAADMVESSIKQLIDGFVPLREDDLRKWETEPEEWYESEEKDSEQWEFELRPSAERVLISFLNNFTDTAKPLILSLYAEATLSQNMDIPSILHKDAVYNSIGRGVHQLRDILNLDQMLSNFLHEIQYENPEYSVVKRRIAWVTGVWVSSEVVPTPPPIAWQILVLLLQDTNIIVRLTAADALKPSLDTLGFNKSVFEPYLKSAIHALVNLVNACETVECKRRAVKALSFVIERSEDLIVSCVDDLSSNIPTLWLRAEEEQSSLLKGDLITMATTLVAATKQMSMGLWTIVVPLVQMGLQPGSKAELDKDAFDLWLMALRCTTTLVNPQIPSPNMLDLLPIALAVFADAIDVMGKVLDIIAAYLLINAPQVLQVCGLQMLQSINQDFPRAPQNERIAVLETAQLLVRKAPSTLWMGPLHHSGFFWSILHTLIEDKKAPAVVLKKHLFFIAWMLLTDKNAFMDLIQGAATAHGQSVDTLLDNLLTAWWDKFDTVAEPHKRKLLAMSVACLVSTGLPVVLNKLTGDIFNIWLDVLCELAEAWKHNPDDEDGTSSLYLREDSKDWIGVDVPLDAIGTLEENRWNQLNEEDPVKTQKLPAFIRQHLEMAAGACPGGPVAFDADYLSKADPLVRTELWKLLGISH